MAITNGLYKVDFATPLGAGSGVAALENGRIRGGDSGLYYVGSYKENGDEFIAEVRTDAHSSGMQSVLGIDRANLSLKGKSTANSANMAGSAKEAPGITFQARLSRLCD